MVTMDETEEGRHPYETEKGNGEESSDCDDSDYIVDLDNVVEDEEVNMNDFHVNIDPNVEWVGSSSLSKVVEELDDGEGCEVLDNETLYSESSSDEGPAAQRKKSIKSLQRAHENEQALVSEPFYIHQKFSSANEFKERVKIHAIETRREIKIVKNDTTRVRVVCMGSLLTIGGSKEEEKNKDTRECPWVLYASKGKKDVDWTVKTYNKEHRCLQTRKIKACTYKYLAEKIVDQVETNPTIPVRALRQQLQQRFQLGFSEMKIMRTRSEAINRVKGDYAGQYGILRDYINELQKRNPETTVKIDVESEPNYDLPSRVFKRIYICLGPLKKGFMAGKRDLLGLDGAFMKGPYPGQLLSDVGLDGNNGTYPVAYALVESEKEESWTWFLTCLGDDLQLYRNSNFTFVSDRQKGLLPAIAKLYPCAEHRFCLRHIHQNMKKRWKGKEFKDHLWTCATISTVQGFQRAMDDLKKLNAEAYEWLKKIPPQHWSRSHFTGRAHSDVLLNNMCEAFNSKLLDARDSPIITSLEYIREYLMRKIVNVQKKIEKSQGPLTPTATKWFDILKTKASELRAVFCGNGKYQVTGVFVDQCVVDMVKQTCSCNRWELTGIPCKHAIAAIWEMRQNKEDVRIPESWVHPTYWLKTWEKMYSFTIEPINGSNMWEKSTCPTTLLPPKHHVPIGRPKKKRKKSVVELEDLVSGHTASRTNKSVTCSKCNNIGHNQRSCKGQGGSG